MKEGSRYLKIVYWSEPDQCFVGMAPGLFHGGCHGDDEAAVYQELIEIVDEVIEDHKKAGDPLPPPTIERVAKLLADNQMAAE